MNDTKKAEDKHMGLVYCDYFFEIEEICQYQSFDWLIMATADYWNADKEDVRRSVQSAINKSRRYRNHY